MALTGMGAAVARIGKVAPGTKAKPKATGLLASKPTKMKARFKGYRGKA